MTVSVNQAPGPVCMTRSLFTSGLASLRLVDAVSWYVRPQRSGVG